MHLMTITLCLSVVLFSCCCRCCVYFQINTFPYLVTTFCGYHSFEIFGLFISANDGRTGETYPKEALFGYVYKTECSLYVITFSSFTSKWMLFWLWYLCWRYIYFKQLCFESRNFDLALKSGKLNFISVIEQESLYMVNWYWASFVFCWVGNSSSFNKPNQLRMEDITIPQGNI